MTISPSPWRSSRMMITVPNCMIALEILLFFLTVLSRTVVIGVVCMCSSFLQKYDWTQWLNWAFSTQESKKQRKSYLSGVTGMMSFIIPQTLRLSPLPPSPFLFLRFPAFSLSLSLSVSFFFNTYCPRNPSSWRNSSASLPPSFCAHSTLCVCAWTIVSWCFPLSFLGGVYPFYTYVFGYSFLVWWW